jgi:HAD superfamily hydrolase (TIGR01509 family)
MACLGGPPTASLRNLLGGDRHVAAALERLMRSFAEQRTEARLFAGARRLLADLRAQGVWTGLWTGRDRASTEAILTQLDLAGLFDGTVCGDDLPSHKPDPAGLAALLDRGGLTAAQALFVGDAEADAIAAHRLGVRMLLIDHGVAIAPAVSAQAAAVVPTPAEAFAQVRATLRTSADPA